MKSTRDRSRDKVYEGKAKILFRGPEPDTLIQYFKDDATAFNNLKKGKISGKGVINNRISGFIMERLQDLGIPTHYIKTLNMREQLVRKVDIIPIELVVRNFAAGSLCKRLNIEEGKLLTRPLIECYYKDDALGDPLVSEEHVLHFEWAEIYELEDMRAIALRVNDFLCGLFAAVGIRLVDFKLEFGRIVQDNMVSLVLADEISPDSCRLWDIKTGNKLDKDRFRHDLGNVEEAYQEVAMRLGVLSKQFVADAEKENGELDELSFETDAESSTGEAC